ncbi:MULTISPECIES: ClpP family protease [Streptomyces]|uniref:ATP-dependent Clp protease proteolytic subunit n=1 Tax=Streptomyces scabiei (strain 87.22) TaxID=680198 RepID=C9ZCK7_STRSW|nr:MULTISPECIES: ATP-dependent Clp protease proteolytic subunit [Streptomyces]MBP5872552.1 ATP-dependent Clp protease proteolytic subunit [Streptomyces sp. LBUM 1485]MBP5909446.1 ATP-dependent Clp protease proteolytic subunit [Streptomyces sp. LBUM 1478]MBP5933220.1 ATP-dependent Clp protease proteolytic subunit [Streptomyces sp. LBUM 1479]KFG05632.1 Clp protease ClpP [Streptomyces scabiei]MBP5895261.1 ATP-dependent Clp protease proteolytic subunit [Streptomyces sp. LBUM 1481]
MPERPPSARHVLPEFTERTGAGYRTLTAMTALYDTNRFVTCDVETVCPGQAGSAAAVLPAAGTPGKRSMLPGARALIHQPAMADPVEGQAGDPAIRAEELTRHRRTMEEMLVRHTGRSPERIGADIERDTFLDAEAAVAYGLADRVVQSRRTDVTPPSPPFPGAR